MNNESKSVEQNSPTVSVVIATYNREAYIAQTLDSLLNQTRLPDEVIVVDDGSTDGTKSVVAGYGDRVRYFRQANSGKSAALNFGLSKARGTHIWFFDDDDVALPDAIEASLSALTANPDADFTYSYKLFYDGDGDIWDETQWRDHRITHCEPERLFVEMLRWCFISLQGMLIAARCFAAVGPFDEQLLRTQDYEMQLKITRRFRGVAVARPMFVIRNHTGVRGTAAKRHQNRNRMKVWRQYDKHTFQRLRAEISLHEYLPESLCEDLSASETSKALLERADIMYHHGLYKEGSEDLAQAVSRGAPEADVDTVIQQVTNVNESAFVPGVADLSQALGRIIRSRRNKHWLKSALRGYYWTLLRMLKRKQWTLAATVFSAIVILAVRGGI